MKHTERCAIFAQNLNTLLEEKAFDSCSNAQLAKKFNQFMADCFPEEMIVINGSVIGNWRKGVVLPCLEYFGFLTKWLDCEPTDLLTLF